MIEGNFARRELEEISVEEISEGTLIVEHNTQKRTMNCETTIVTDVTQLSELVHVLCSNKFLLRIGTANQCS